MVRYGKETDFLNNRKQVIFYNFRVLYSFVIHSHDFGTYTFIFCRINAFVMKQRKHHFLQQTKNVEQFRKALNFY